MLKWLNIDWKLFARDMGYVFGVVLAVVLFSAAFIVPGYIIGGEGGAKIASIVLVVVVGIGCVLGLYKDSAK